MNVLSRWLLGGAQNVVPVGGWFLGGWSPATMLVVFWFENLLLTMAIASRIVAHRRATRKRGHEGGFLSHFLVTALAFCFGHAVFLAVVLFQLPDGTPNRQELQKAIQWMLVAQIVSLAVDMFGIAGWPFAELRRRTDWLLGRVVVVHLSIIGGMFLAFWYGKASSFFSIFLVLKVLIDISSLLPKYQYEPGEPPAWLARLTKRLPAQNGKGTFEEHWRRETKMERERFARDEEVVGDA